MASIILTILVQFGYNIIYKYICNAYTPFSGKRAAKKSAPTTVSICATTVIFLLNFFLLEFYSSPIYYNMKYNFYFMNIQ